jgi:protein involved in polysaccharide export with SLBB domain
LHSNAPPNSPAELAGFRPPEELAQGHNSERTERIVARILNNVTERIRTWRGLQQRPEEGRLQAGRSVRNRNGTPFGALSSYQHKK